MVRLLICSLVFCLAAASSWAQGPDKGRNQAETTQVCKPDCLNDNFICYENVTWTMYGCSWTAYYCYRKACGIWCDVQPISVYCNTNPPCMTLTPSQVFEMAAKQIIYDVSLTKGLLDCIPTAEGQCRPNWRVTASSCWKWHLVAGPVPDWRVTICEVNTCCLFLYEMCIVDGEYQIRRLSSATDPTPCPSGCMKVCNE